MLFWQDFDTLSETINGVDIRPVLHQFVADMAEHALTRNGVDNPKAWAAVEAKRQWLAGEITDGELYQFRCIAVGAAYGASSDAKWDHTPYAHSFWAAAWAAAGIEFSWYMVGEVSRHAANHDRDQLDLFAEWLENMITEATTQPQQLALFTEAH